MVDNNTSWSCSVIVKIMDVI